MRRFYTRQHRFYCGIDLHARLLAICIVDHDTATVVCRTQIPADKQRLLDTLAPYRADVVVAVECLFAWYWVADLCAAEKIPFVLGHALYMKAIHGGKAKNDDIDAEKISRLLRGGNIPVAYVYPKGLRETRDLLRRRMHLVHQRAGLITHIQILNAQNNLPDFGKKLIYAKNRAELKIAERFLIPHVRKSVEIDLALIDAAHLEKNCWHCFRCGAGGNALDLYLAVTRLPIYAGALELCARLHLPVPRLDTPASQRVCRPP